MLLPLNAASGHSPVRPGSAPAAPMHRMSERTNYEWHCRRSLQRTSRCGGEQTASVVPNPALLRWEYPLNGEPLVPRQFPGTTGIGAELPVCEVWRSGHYRGQSGPRQTVLRRTFLRTEKSLRQCRLRSTPRAKEALLSQSTAPLGSPPRLALECRAWGGASIASGAMPTQREDGDGQTANQQARKGRDQGG